MFLRFTHISAISISHIKYLFPLILYIEKIISDIVRKAGIRQRTERPCTSQSAAFRYFHPPSPHEHQVTECFILSIGIRREEDLQFRFTLLQLNVKKNHEVIARPPVSQEVMKLRSRMLLYMVLIFKICFNCPFTHRNTMKGIKAFTSDHPSSSSQLCIHRD